jgi:3-methyladenine DNA glycosylase AlkD
MKARSQSFSTPKRRSNRSAVSVSSPVAGPEWSADQVLAELQGLGTQRNIDGMAHFGIRSENVYGVSKPKLDALAKRIGRGHSLALDLWLTGNHDARILAGMIADPRQITSTLMDLWVRDFNNWDVCDGTCCHLFVFAKPAWSRAVSWTSRKEEFQKRAGFALAAYLAYRDKSATDVPFEKFLKIIEREAGDDRNFVRKAVNWALRNIGKRNLRLNRAAIAAALRIQKSNSRAARWIAADALRELRSEAVQSRLRRKES